MQTTATLIAEHRADIEALADSLERRTGATILVDYGTTDDGQEDACLLVESLPWGSLGRPGALVSIVTGSGVPVGAFGVMGAAGAILAHGVTLVDAIKVASNAGAKEWRRMTQKASHAA